MRRNFKRPLGLEPLEGRPLLASAAAGLAPATAADFSIDRDRFDLDGDRTTFGFANTVGGAQFDHDYTMDVSRVGSGGGQAIRARDALAVFLGRLGSYLQTGTPGTAVTQGQYSITGEKFHSTSDGGAVYTMTLRTGPYQISQRYRLSASKVSAGTVLSQSLDLSAAEQFSARLAQHADALLQARDHTLGTSRLGSPSVGTTSAFGSSTGTASGFTGTGTGAGTGTGPASGTGFGNTSSPNGFGSGYPYGFGNPYGTGTTGGYAGNYGYNGGYGNTGTGGGTATPVIVPSVPSNGGTTSTGTTPGTSANGGYTGTSGVTGPNIGNSPGGGTTGPTYPGQT